MIRISVCVRVSQFSIILSFSHFSNALRGSRECFAVHHGIAMFGWLKFAIFRAHQVVSSEYLAARSAKMCSNVMHQFTESCGGHLASNWLRIVTYERLSIRKMAM